MNIIKNYWGYMIPIALIAGVFFLINNIASCTEKHEAETVQTLTTEQVKQHAIDSVNLLRNAEKLFAIDSVLNLSRGRLQIVQTEVSKSKKETAKAKDYANALERAYTEAKSLEQCDSTIQAKNLVISSQDSTIKELDCEAQEYSFQVEKLNEKLAIKDSNISIYQSRVQVDSLYLEQYKKSVNKEIKANKVQKFIFKWLAVGEAAFILIKSI